MGDESPSPSRKRPREAPTCGSCGVQGHTRSSRECPHRVQQIADQDLQLRAAVVSQTDRLTPDWDAVGTFVALTPLAAHHRFNEITTPQERVAIARDKFSPELLEQLICERENQCAQCTAVYFDAPRVWRDAALCRSCYGQSSLERAVMWSRVRALALSLGPACGFCGALFVEAGFHFDHLNMFDKAGSVCTLIKTGSPWEAVEAEVAKCQVLCPSCHALVTHIENVLGLTALKKSGGMSPEEGAAFYAELMPRVYEHLGARVRSALSTPSCRP